MVLTVLAVSYLGSIVGTWIISNQHNAKMQIITLRRINDSLEVELHARRYFDSLSRIRRITAVSNKKFIDAERRFQEK